MYDKLREMYVIRPRIEYDQCVFPAQPLQASIAVLQDSNIHRKASEPRWTSVEVTGALIRAGGVSVLGSGAEIGGRGEGSGVVVDGYWGPWTETDRRGSGGRGGGRCGVRRGTGILEGQMAARRTRVVGT